MAQITVTLLDEHSPLVTKEVFDESRLDALKGVPDAVLIMSLDGAKATFIPLALILRIDVEDPAWQPPKV